MKRLLLILPLALLMACGTPRAAQNAAPEASAPQELTPEEAELEAYAPLDSLLGAYFETLALADVEVKIRECDFLIESCQDSLTRRHVALRILDHYIDSNIMGEEAVAVHIFDEWMATGKIAMRGEFDYMAAEMFATFNRNTLLGVQAPVITLHDPDGNAVTMPRAGETNILYFFDTSCSKCRIVASMLPQALDEIDFPVNLFAVYSGSDEQAWESFRKQFIFANGNIHVFHLWDPDLESDYQRLYGVLTTPRLYVIEPQGSVIGRRLEVDSLVEVLGYAGAIQAVYDQYLKAPDHEKD